MLNYPKSKQQHSLQHVMLYCITRSVRFDVPFLPNYAAKYGTAINILHKINYHKKQLAQSECYPVLFTIIQVTFYNDEPKLGSHTIYETKNMKKLHECMANGLSVLSYQFVQSSVPYLT